MSPWFHPEEPGQVGALRAYERAHPGSKYLITFADGESYICRYFTSYESGNWGEVDQALGDSATDADYDEFHEIAMHIERINQDGPRRYNEYLTLTYRDFPARIANADTGEVVYAAAPQVTAENLESPT